MKEKKSKKTFRKEKVNKCFDWLDGHDAGTDKLQNNRHIKLEDNVQNLN